MEQKKRKGSDGVLDYFNKVRCVQFDPLDVVGRNVDLVLQSRVTNYRSEVLQDLLCKERSLYDAAGELLELQIEDSKEKFYIRSEDAPLLCKSKTGGGNRV